MNRVITIDGFASSGKTTLSRKLAKKIGWKWLSTGVIYRGIAYVKNKENWDLEKTVQFVSSSQGWELVLDAEKTRFIYQGNDITEKLYDSKVDDWSSCLSSEAHLRKALLPFQRGLLLHCPKGLISEGRDCGTKVFPLAPLKVFLVADEEVRAERRSQDRSSEDFSQTLQAQKVRDHRDKKRNFAPTLEPENCLKINTGSVTLEDMVEKVYQKALEIFKKSDI